MLPWKAPAALSDTPIAAAARSGLHPTQLSQLPPPNHDYQAQPPSSDAQQQHPQSLYSRPHPSSMTPNYPQQPGLAAFENPTNLGTPQLGQGGMGMMSHQQQLQHSHLLHQQMQSQQQQQQSQSSPQAGLSPSAPVGPGLAPSPIPPPPPPPITLASTLHFLQTEHRRYARDRNEWEIERAEMRARIALLEGEKRGNEGALRDLGRRCKMLEMALRGERSKFLSTTNAGTLSGAIPGGLSSVSSPSPSGTSSPVHGLPATSLLKSALTTSSAASLPASSAPESAPMVSTSSTSSTGISAVAPQIMLSNASALSTHQRAASNVSSVNGNGGTWGTFGGTSAATTSGGAGVVTTGRDPRGKARSRDYLKQCLQEITYLTSTTTLNPLLSTASYAAPSVPRPRKTLPTEGVPLPPYPGSTPASAPGIIPIPASFLQSQPIPRPTPVSVPAASVGIALGASPIELPPPQSQPLSQPLSQPQPQPHQTAYPSDPASVFVPLKRQLSVGGARSIGGFAAGERDDQTRVEVEEVSEEVEDVGDESHFGGEERTRGVEMETKKEGIVGQRTETEMETEEKERNIDGEQRLTAIYVPESKEKWKEQLREAGLRAYPSSASEDGGGEVSTSAKSVESAVVEAQLEVEGESKSISEAKDSSSLPMATRVEGKSGVGEVDLDEKIAALRLEETGGEDAGDEKKLDSLEWEYGDDEENGSDASGKAGGKSSSTASAAGALVKGKKTLRSHLGAIRALAVSPSRGILVSGSDDMTIKIWSLSSLVPTSSSRRAPSDPEPLLTLRGHLAPITSILLPPPGAPFDNFLLSASLDSTIRIWRLPSSSIDKIDPYALYDATMEVCTLEAHEEAVWDLLWLGSDGGGAGEGGKATFLSCSADGTVKKWEVGSEGSAVVSASWSFEGAEEQGNEGNVEARRRPVKMVEVGAAESGGTRRVAVAWTDGIVLVCEVESGEVEQRMEIPRGEGLEPDEISDLLFLNISSPTGALSHLLISHATSLSLFNLATSQPLLTLPAHTDAITSLSLLSPTRFVSVGHDTSIRFWAVEKDGSEIIPPLVSHRRASRATSLNLACDCLFRRPIFPCAPIASAPAIPTPPVQMSTALLRKSLTPATATATPTTRVAAASSSFAQSTAKTTWSPANAAPRKALRLFTTSSTSSLPSTSSASSSSILTTPLPPLLSEIQTINPKSKPNKLPASSSSRTAAPLGLTDPPPPLTSHSLSLLYAATNPPPLTALAAFKARLRLDESSSTKGIAEFPLPLLEQCLIHPSFWTDVTSLPPRSFSASRRYTHFHDPLKTHKGPLSHTHNGPLSVLGNSILGLLTSELLLATFPNLPTRVTKAALTMYAGPGHLAEVAKGWGVAPGRRDMVLVGREGKEEMKKPQRGDRSYGHLVGGVGGARKKEVGAEESGAGGGLMRWGRRPSTPVQDAILFEDALASTSRAVVGAIHQIHGFSAARTFTYRHFLSRLLPSPSSTSAPPLAIADLSPLLKFTNPTRVLSLTLTRHSLPPATHRLLKETGRLSAHPTFLVGVFSGESKLGEGFGSSLKMAMWRASEDALRRGYLGGGGGRGTEGLPSGRWCGEGEEVFRALEEGEVEVAEESANR